MTQADFYFIEALYKAAKKLNDKLDENPNDTVAQIQFEALDVVEAMVSNTSQKVKLLDEKIYNIQSHVLRETKGMLTLPKELIVGIIEKAVI